MNSPRPILDSIPLSDAIRPGRVTVTMSTGQWDELLNQGYLIGWTLLELDDNERPIAAYRKQQAALSA
jgi:hypothetical protein